MKRRRLDVSQCRPRQVRTAAARNYCADYSGAIRRRGQRGGGAGAGAEIANVEAYRVHVPVSQSVAPIKRSVSRPMLNRRSRLRIGNFFVGREEINQQGGKSRILKGVGDIAIARTVTTAPAAVSKQHDSASPFDQAQVAFQNITAGGNLNEAILPRRT